MILPVQVASKLGCSGNLQDLLVLGVLVVFVRAVPCLSCLPSCIKAVFPAVAGPNDPGVVCIDEPPARSGACLSVRRGAVMLAGSREIEQSRHACHEQREELDLGSMRIFRQMRCIDSQPSQIHLGK